MANENGDNPRIIVDEDWKTQVEREKEALAKARHASPKPDPALGVLPPATLASLIMSLTTQALAALGQIGDSGSGKFERRPAEARHLIDLLEVLHSKTEGNRTPEESALLDDVLHQLRLAYVSLADSTLGNAS